MNLKEKLSKVQKEMKAPKNLYNKFGNYKYRNAEGILEAFKPFEEKYNICLVVRDYIEVYADRVYVKAVATIYDNESDETMVSFAFAREPESKKGMDDSQITGTASSYARKYALNGLLLLDDTKDADSDEHKIETDAKARVDRIDKVKADTLRNYASELGVDLAKILKYYKVKTVEDMDINIWSKAMKTLDNQKAKNTRKGGEN